MSRPEQQSPVPDLEKGLSWWRLPSFSVEDMWRVIVVVALLLVHYFGIRSQVDSLKNTLELTRYEVSSMRGQQMNFVTAAQLSSVSSIQDEIHRRLEARDLEIQRGLDRLQNRIDAVESRQEIRRR